MIYVSKNTCVKKNLNVLCILISRRYPEVGKPLYTNFYDPVSFGVSSWTPYKPQRSLHAHAITAQLLIHGDYYWLYWVILSPDDIADIYPSLPKSFKNLVTRCLKPLKAFSGGVCGSQGMTGRLGLPIDTNFI